jgi:hypothetical protein
MKYESPITCHSKDMANVKVFEKWVKLQDEGHKVKTFGTNRKVLSKETHMEYESPITYHSKDMANVKFFADRRTGQKLYAPDLSIRGDRNNLLNYPYSLRVKKN